MRLKYEAKNAWEFERENNKLEDLKKMDIYQ